MKVKVCGVARAEDAKMACELGAWAVGMIFAPSPRRITVEAAKAVREAIPQGVLAVGVFQGAPRGEINRAVKELALDVVQLHGMESPDECSGYKAKVWKALPGEPGAANAARIYPVDAVLIEPRRGAPREEQVQAWKSAALCKAGGAPFVLVAGGLSPENAAEAARVSKADALDVSSGVESAPGVKDPAKLEAFFAALR